MGVLLFCLFFIVTPTGLHKGGMYLVEVFKITQPAYIMIVGMAIIGIYALILISIMAKHLKEAYVITEK